MSDIGEICGRLDSDEEALRLLRHAVDDDEFLLSASIDAAADAVVAVIEEIGV